MEKSGLAVFVLHNVFFFLFLVQALGLDLVSKLGVLWVRLSEFGIGVVFSGVVNLLPAMVSCVYCFECVWDTSCSCYSSFISRCPSDMTDDFMMLFVKCSFVCVSRGG